MTEETAIEHAYVYRTFNPAGRLLYVGLAVNPERRFLSHEHNAAWFGEIAAVTIERHSDIVTARAAERKAIKTEWPLWNIAHSPEGHIVQLIEYQATLARMNRMKTTPISRLRGAARRSREMSLARAFERHIRHGQYVRRMVRRAQFAADYPEAAAREAERWERVGWRDFPGSPEDVYMAKERAIFRLYELEKAEEDARDAASST